MQMSDFACAAPNLSSGSSGTSNLERNDGAQPGPPAVIDGLRTARSGLAGRRHPLIDGFRLCHSEGMGFRLVVNYRPRGDQETAIAELTRGIREGEQHQVLLGVTGSGKTFTMAKVMEAIGRPALVLAHNKTLAAQLYHEFKSF